MCQRNSAHFLLEHCYMPGTRNLREGVKLSWVMEVLTRPSIVRMTKCYDTTCPDFDINAEHHHRTVTPVCCSQVGSGSQHLQHQVPD